jgi:hypothetical protein
MFAAWNNATYANALFDDRRQATHWTAVKCECVGPAKDPGDKPRLGKHYV